jgi:hypothetical protein
MTGVAKLTLEDRAEIADLYLRYVFAFDDNLAEVCADLYAEDGSFAVVRVEESMLRLVALGRYQDDLVRTEAGWRYRERRFTPFTDGTLSGAVLAAPVGG